jgi:hypothetical protein
MEGRQETNPVLPIYESSTVTDRCREGFVCYIIIYHQISFERGPNKNRDRRSESVALSSGSRRQHSGQSRCQFQMSRHSLTERPITFLLSLLDVPSGCMAGSEHAIMLPCYHLREDAIERHILCSILM